MAPNRTREQPERQVHAVTQGIAPDVIAKRTKRHLDELERSNYAEPSLLAFGNDDDDGGGKLKGRARQMISVPSKNKKQAKNIRTALLYQKNLATLIEESNIAHLPPHSPSYLTAVTSPPTTPRRLLCSVCGYWGSYKCKRCTMPFCDRNCENVHAETRCEKRVV